MLKRTFITKSQETAGAFKADKDRVALLFYSNASGDKMLKALLINKSLRQRALKCKQLPVTTTSEH